MIYKDQYGIMKDLIFGVTNYFGFNILKNTGIYGDEEKNLGRSSRD